MNCILKELFCVYEAPLSVLKLEFGFIVGELNFPGEQWFCLC
jgi:hypothetical protein